MGWRSVGCDGGGRARGDPSARRTSGRLVFVETEVRRFENTATRGLPRRRATSISESLAPLRLPGTSPRRRRASPAQPRARSVTRRTHAPPLAPCVALKRPRAACPRSPAPSAARRPRATAHPRPFHLAPSETRPSRDSSFPSHPRRISPTMVRDVTRHDECDDAPRAWDVDPAVRHRMERIASLPIEDLMPPDDAPTRGGNRDPLFRQRSGRARRRKHRQRRGRCRPFIVTFG